MVRLIPFYKQSPLLFGLQNGLAAELLTTTQL